MESLVSRSRNYWFTTAIFVDTGYFISYWRQMRGIQLQTNSFWTATHDLPCCHSSHFSTNQKLTLSHYLPLPIFKFLVIQLLVLWPTTHKFRAFSFGRLLINYNRVIPKVVISVVLLAGTLGHNRAWWLQNSYFTEDSRNCEVYNKLGSPKMLQWTP